MFAPNADESELAKVRARSDLEFIADSAEGDTFTLAPGELALFDLGHEGLVLRIPQRMSGRYRIYERGFRVEFSEGEELEGCKRILLLVCNRVVSVDVNEQRVDVRAPNRLFDLLVEF